MLAVLSSALFKSTPLEFVTEPGNGGLLICPRERLYDWLLGLPPPDFGKWMALPAEGLQLPMTLGAELGADDAAWRGWAGLPAKARVGRGIAHAGGGW